MKFYLHTRVGTGIIYYLALRAFTPAMTRRVVVLAVLAAAQVAATRLRGSASEVSSGTGLISAARLSYCPRLVRWCLGTTGFLRRGVRVEGIGRYCGYGGHCGRKYAA